MIVAKRSGTASTNATQPCRRPGKHTHKSAIAKRTAADRKNGPAIQNNIIVQSSHYVSSIFSVLATGLSTSASLSALSNSPSLLLGLLGLLVLLCAAFCFNSSCLSSADFKPSLSRFRAASSASRYSFACFSISSFA